MRSSMQLEYTLPDSWDEIEQVLMARKHEAWRNWEWGMTLQELKNATPFLHFSWTDPRTWIVNEVVTASIGNIHWRDNLRETAPAKVTTKGDLIVGLAANSIARLAVGADGQTPIADSTQTGGVRYGHARLYSGGGEETGPTNVTTVDRISSMTDTTTTITSAALSAARNGGIGVGGASTKNYTCGGGSGGVVTTGDKLTLASEVTAATASSNLSVARGFGKGLSNRSTKGYFIGGYDGTNLKATADKITFATDTTAAASSADLPAARSQPDTVNEGTTKGYIVGGVATLPNTTSANAYKVTYSTDITTAQSSANRSAALFSGAGHSEGTSKGYWIGGMNSTPAAVTTSDKIVFSTDTTAACTSANLGTAQGIGISGSDGAARGLTVGGTTGAFTAKAWRTAFANDTTYAQVSCNLSAARDHMATMSDTGW